MSRIEKVNELLKIELANLISREIPTENFLITVSYVECSLDLKNAKIGITVLPENLNGTALKRLRAHNSQFSNILKKKLNLRVMPKFNWLIDSFEKEASKIDEILEKIKNEEL